MEHHGVEYPINLCEAHSSQLNLKISIIKEIDGHGRNYMETGQNHHS